MLPCVTPNLWDESQFSIAPSAIDSLNYSPGSEWTSKQMTGDINSFITEAKSPVIEEGGSEIARPQQRRKEIRCMSHMSQSNRTEKPSQKPQKGKYWITRAVSSLTLHLLHLELFLSPFSHAHRRKTQTFLSPPPGERVNGPLILRSEDQSQQGSHVCQMKKNGGGRANMGAAVHARAGGWKERQRRNGVNARGMKHKPCNSLQRGRLKENCRGDRQKESIVAVAVPASPPLSLAASFVAN